MGRHKIEKDILKAQQAITQDPAAFLSSVLEGIGDAVVLIDKDFKLISANSGYLSQTKYSLEDIIGRHCYEISHHAKKPCDESGEECCSVRQAFLTGERHRTIHAHFDKHGNTLYVEVCAYPLKDSKGNIVSIIQTLTDVTEKISLDNRLKESEDERAALETRLVQSQKLEAIGILAGGIAHDFNNILTGILSYAQLADMHASDPNVKKALKQIFILGQKSAALIKQILLMGRPLPPELKVIDLNSFLQEALTTFQRIIEENIEIKLSISKDTAYVKADPSQLNQALMNLTVNARDAMIDKGGIIKIKTNVFEPDEAYCKKYPYAKLGRYAVISVADSGLGIPEEIRDKIFEPFFTTKSLGKGSGLGLSVTYSVIKNHGGWINFYSEPEKGTEFLIYLPMIEHRAAAP